MENVQKEIDGSLKSFSKNELTYLMRQYQPYLKIDLVRDIKKAIEVADEASDNAFDDIMREMK